MKSILFIGANDMREFKNYISKYNSGFFIEPIPKTFDVLVNNLSKCNQQNNTNYIPLNYLITNEDDKDYKFNIYGEMHKHREVSEYGNNGASSSIFEKGSHFNDWGNCDCNISINMKSTRMSTLINKLSIDIENCDVIVDVQGAELEVLKSFDDKLMLVDNIITEISNVEYYKGGVLFKELNAYLNSYGLFTKECTNIINSQDKIHKDILYERTKD